MKPCPPQKKSILHLPFIIHHIPLTIHHTSYHCLYSIIFSNLCSSFILTCHAPLFTHYSVLYFTTPYSVQHTKFSCHSPYLTLHSMLYYPFYLFPLCSPYYIILCHNPFYKLHTLFSILTFCYSFLFVLFHSLPSPNLPPYSTLYICIPHNLILHNLIPHSFFCTFFFHSPSSILYSPLHILYSILCSICFILHSFFSIPTTLTVFYVEYSSIYSTHSIIHSPNCRLQIL